jgi:hypothetical protein
MYSQLFLEKSAISDIKGVHFIWVNGREGKGKEREKRIPSNRTRTHPTGKDMYRVPPLKQMRASPPTLACHQQPGSVYTQPLYRLPQSWGVSIVGHHLAMATVEDQPP